MTTKHQNRTTGEAVRTDRRMSLQANLRAEGDSDSDSRRVTGHAALFDTLSQDLGGFREQIASGAFTRAIREDDVRALWNHDPNFVLARSQAGEGTLTLREDSTGLLCEWDMPNGPQGDFFLESIRSGNVSQMSFNFIPDVIEWAYPEEGPAIATVRDAQLFDVSPVTYPAYLETDIQARNFRQENQRRDDPGAALADAPADTDDEDLDDDQAAIDAEIESDQDLDLQLDLEIEAAELHLAELQEEKAANDDELEDAGLEDLIEDDDEDLDDDDDLDDDELDD